MSANCVGQINNTPKRQIRLPVVYLVRHGETEWSKTGQHTSTTEVELTSHGITQARDLSRFVFENQCQDFTNPSNIDLILVSPRKRAQQTLGLITLPKKDQIPTFTDPNLAEWNYGDYEGITTHEIHREMDAPNGETIQQVATRCDHMIAKVMTHQNDHMDNNPSSPSGDVLVVAHSHLLRILACRWLNMPPESGRHFIVDTAGLCVLGYDRSMRTPVIKQWNVTSHLFQRSDE
ncbi:18470_t:CDS:2 [Rhizophagus irregularis]|nr:18470_t:CDS:2 [Rhizophagus irregularis]